jgi:hypothetical protein
MSKQARLELTNSIEPSPGFGWLVPQPQTDYKWLTHVEHNLSPTTLRRYKSLLPKRILAALGDRPVSSIRAIDLDELYQGHARRVGLSSASRGVHDNCEQSSSKPESVKGKYEPRSEREYREDTREPPQGGGEGSGPKTDRLTCGTGVNARSDCSRCTHHERAASISDTYS